MSLAEFSQYALLWIKSRLRNGPEEADLDAKVVAKLVVLQPFASNLTKAFKLVDAEVEEIIDFAKFLESQDVSAKWKEVLRSFVENQEKVQRDLEVVRRSPGKPSPIADYKPFGNPGTASGAGPQSVLFKEEDGLEEKVVDRSVFKKPEVVLGKQGGLSILEYYADFMDSVQDLKISREDLTILFKSGLNGTSRESYLTGLKCGTVERGDLKSVARYIAHMSKITEVTLMNEKDRLFQKYDERPEEFLKRWARFLTKAEVLDLQILDPIKTFAGKLQQGATIVAMAGNISNDKREYQRVLTFAGLVQGYGDNTHHSTTSTEVSVAACGL